MQMTRRQFGKRSLATVATLTLAPSFMATLAVEGCSEAKQILNDIINSAQALLALEPNAVWAQDLSAAIAALQQAEASWTSGGAVAVVEDALNTLEAVLAVIPMTAAFSPLVDILVAGIEAVLNVLFPQPATSAAAKAKFNALSDPHRGRVTVPPGSTRAQQIWFVNAWNAEAKTLGLSQATIR